MYEDFKSKYYDLADYVKSISNDNNSAKVSILKDVAFDLELIQRDEITLSYILQLLAKSSEYATQQEQKEKTDKILKDVDNTPNLRSKKELIRKFIANSMQGLNADSIEDGFEAFMEIERQKEVSKLCKDEKLDSDALKTLIDNFLYEERKPRNQEIIEVLQTKPKILDRKSIVDRVFDKIQSLVDKFYK
jgi:type I restriction enzyme R subunit